jgi:hypothetical protein
MKPAPAAADPPSTPRYRPENEFWIRQIGRIGSPVRIQFWLAVPSHGICTTGVPAVVEVPFSVSRHWLLKRFIIVYVFAPTEVSVH